MTTPRNQAFYDAIAEAVRQGGTTYEVGARFGISSQWVGRVATRRGIQLRTGRKHTWPDCPPELHGQWKRLQKKGVSAVEARALLEGRRA